MWMIRTAIDLKLSQHLATKCILREHPPDRMEDQIPRPLLQKLFRRCRFESPGITAVAVIHLIVPLPTCQSDFSRIDYNNVITRVGMGGIDRLVFSSESSGNESSQSPQNTPSGINDIPPLMNFRWFGAVRFHDIISRSILIVFKFFIICSDFIYVKGKITRIMGLDKSDAVSLCRLFSTRLKREDIPSKGVNKQALACLTASIGSGMV